MAAAGSLAPLRHSAFRWLLTGRTASFLGNAVAPVALAFAVLDLAGSATVLGLIIACRTVPQVIFMLLGGVISDRFPRTQVIVVANCLGAVTQGISAILLITGHAELWQLAVIQAVNGATTAFAFPAGAGLTPQTVPNAILQQANALLRLAINSALIGGAVIAGLLVASVGSGWAIAFDAVTFAIGAFAIARIKLVSEEAEKDATGAVAPRTSMLTELREGWREFSSRRWLWSVVVAFSCINAADSGAISVIGPLVADGSIGRAAWGAVLAALAAGMALGALVTLRLRPRRNLFVGMLGVFGTLPMLIAMAVDPSLPLLLILAVISGLGIEVFATNWDLSMQQHVPLAALSRVYSYDALGSILIIPLGQVAAGPLTAAFGAETTLLLAAGVIAVAIVATLSVSSVRTLERTDLPIHSAG